VCHGNPAFLHGGGPIFLLWTHELILAPLLLVRNKTSGMSLVLLEAWLVN
jgi:hypothetical protein